ncbi:MAG: DUF1579 domain-containing protein, partial [Chthoniobacterales bacterium]
MKNKTVVATLAAVATATLLTAPALAAEPTPNDTSSPASAAQPSDAEMMKQMMELSKPNENHKLLGQLAGHWNYTVQMWMAPGTPPQKSSGSGVTKAIMGGRYYVTNATGQMEMPGPDGKMHSMTFKGMGIDGYDNMHKHFVSAWVDNLGTGILTSTGSYDPGSKTFTYTSEEEMVPGTKTKVREVIKLVDKNHHTFEWYEERGGQEVKTMEIDYT